MDRKLRATCYSRGVLRRGVPSPRSQSVSEGFKVPTAGPEDSDGRTEASRTDTLTLTRHTRRLWTGHANTAGEETCTGAEPTGGEGPTTRGSRVNTGPETGGVGCDPPLYDRVLDRITPTSVHRELRRMVRGWALSWTSGGVGAPDTGCGERRQPCRVGDRPRTLWTGSYTADSEGVDRRVEEREGTHPGQGPLGRDWEGWTPVDRGGSDGRTRRASSKLGVTSGTRHDDRQIGRHLGR